jgi:hypothetical protein
MTDQIASIVGVVFDAKRNADNDYSAPKSSVFGLNAKEHKVFKEQNVEVMPREFTPEATRYQMNASPWRVMRILGSIGYQISVPPIGGRVQTFGEKRTGVYTLVKYSLGDRSVKVNV